MDAAGTTGVGDAMPGTSRRAELVRSILGILVFVLALWTLREALGAFDLAEARAAVDRVPARSLANAAALTLASYLMMGLTEGLGFRYLGRDDRARSFLVPGFIAYTFSQTIGLAVLTGGSVRYRLYEDRQVSAGEVSLLVAFLSWTAWVGLLAMAGAAFVLDPPSVTAVEGVPALPLRPLGGLFLGSVAAYLAWCGLRDEPLEVRGWSLPTPSLRLGVQSTAYAAVRWTLMGGVLYTVLPAGQGVGYLEVLAVFLLAQTLGNLSHVPGGLGVLEFVVLALLEPAYGTNAVVGALVLYRGFVYLLPLAMASVLMGAEEVARRTEVGSPLADRLAPLAEDVLPDVLALATFTVGALLLFTGTLPLQGGPLAAYTALLPTPVLEASRFLGSLVGGALLLVARGLQRRLRSAWWTTVVATAVGIPLALLRGFDWVGAVGLTVLLATLLPARDRFPERTRLDREGLTPGWTAAIVVVVGGALWLTLLSTGLLAPADVPWWRYVLAGEAPPVVRAAAGVAGLVVLVVVLLLVGSSGEGGPAEPGS